MWIKWMAGPARARLRAGTVGGLGAVVCALARLANAVGTAARARAANAVGTTARPRLAALTAALAAATALAQAAPAQAASPHHNGVPPFVPIHYIRLHLPNKIQPYGPNWTPDGRHIIFQNQVNGRTWVIGANGRHLHCITCHFSNDPGPKMQGGLFFVYAFPGDKRLFLGSGVDVTYSSTGAASEYGLSYLGALLGDPIPGPAPKPDVADVIECHPSIFRCRSHKVLPVDFSADANPTEPVGQRRTWHLSPDGKHLLWMEVRPDGTVMIVAKLVRRSDRYIAADPRYINPPGPTGPSDPNPSHWAYTGQTFEGKSFADGGREVEYLGGNSLDNFDVETVNLPTGARHRLTSAPDWDEDGSISPEGRYLVTASWRTMHRFDVLGGMLPEIHSYIDLPFMSAMVANYVSSHKGFQCDLTPWLLPAGGDRGGSLLGQPLGPYVGGRSYVANNLVGTPMWNPAGNEVLLQERIYGPPRGSGSLEPVLGAVPHRLLIAKLGIRPHRPIPVASSHVGRWAPSPASAGTGFDHPTTVTIHGRRGGTATLTYTGNILSSDDSVAYHHFSDDGRSFADGTETVQNPQLLTTPVTFKADITISGAHHGYLHANLTAGESKGQVPTGTIVSVYDGKRRSGLPAAGACPRSMPHPVHLLLHEKVKPGASTARIALTVTASIAGAGMNELGSDRRPVQHATVLVAGRRLFTNSAGHVAFVLAERTGKRRVRLTVTAGDTFVPAHTTIQVPGSNRSAQ